MADRTTSVDDDEIALLLMVGDKEGVRLLAREHGPPVLGFLKKHFPLQAEDAFQEALRKVLTSIDTFDDKRGKLGAWFLAVAHNAARDLVRGERKHRHVSYDQAGEVAAPMVDGAGSDAESGEYDPQTLDEDRNVLMGLLNGLPQLQREILLRDAAHRDGRVPAALLADDLQSTVGSIRANRAKAWKAIDDQLRKQGLPPRRKS